MCHEHQRIPFETDDVVAMVRKVFDGRVVFHDGDDALAPGVTLHHIGGHSMGLQCVRVKTRRGHVVLASDATHLYAHVNEGRSRRCDLAVCQRLVSAVVISDVVMPAPKRRHSARNGLSVTPAMGASTNGLSST
jgi:hypothetical protein